MEGTALQLVKARLGISSTVRDFYIIAIIEGIMTELLEEKGLSLKEDNSYHLMFIVDFATWRYQNRDSTDGMPRHLQYRLHNLMIKSGGVTSDV
jgi:hypothetical protein